MFARIIDNVAVDISTNPTAEYHPIVAKQFESVPENVRSGWILSDGNWSAPPEPDMNDVELPTSPEQAYPILNPVEFKLLFTSTERLKLNELRKTDPVLDDFLSIIDDPRLTQVDLGLQSMQDSVTECLTALVAAGTIGDQAQADKRKTAILTGVTQ